MWRGFAVGLVLVKMAGWWVGGFGCLGLGDMSSEKAVRFLGGDGSSEEAGELIVRECVVVESMLKTRSFVKILCKHFCLENKMGSV